MPTVTAESSRTPPRRLAKQSAPSLVHAVREWLQAARVLAGSGCRANHLGALIARVERKAAEQQGRQLPSCLSKGGLR